MSEFLSSADTANDRFKRSYSNLAWAGILTATIAHFALFFFFPRLEAADLSTVGDELLTIELPPEVKIPPPPEQIARPATPIVWLMPSPTIMTSARPCSTLSLSGSSCF